jgi:hypothetical protein
VPTAIFAATILFTGLICHVKDPNSDNRTAYLIVAPHHDAYIEVPQSALDTTATTWTAPLSGNTYYYTLNAHQLEIYAGDSSSAVRPDSDFDTHVPHLSKIVNVAKPKLNQLLTQGQLYHSKASLRYTSGNLGVLSCYYDSEMSFPPPATQGTMCVARWTKLEFKTTINWEIRNPANSKKIVFKPGALIRVWNMGSQGSDHYLHHADLLDSGAVVPWNHTSSYCSTASCTAIAPAPMSNHSPYVDCSSSQWP